MRTIFVLALLIPSAVCPPALAAQARRDSSHHAAHHAANGRTEDSAFMALQARGKRAMGVDQYAITHTFDALPDGGRIALRSNSGDSADVGQIRRHMREVARAFKAGDFAGPAFVHSQTVPGTTVMAEKREAIIYEPRDLPFGAEVRIRTSDPDAVRAIEDFMAFQRADHRANGKGHRPGAIPELERAAQKPRQEDER